MKKFFVIALFGCLAGGTQAFAQTNLNCTSESINIGVALKGQVANIMLNSVVRTYNCVGPVSGRTAKITCETSADDAPKFFRLSTNSSGEGNFQFSGFPPSPIHCS